MAKTPTVERETATFRLPATLLERARRDGAEVYPSTAMLILVPGGPELRICVMLSGT